jgi:phosphate:Na+ symporter
MLLALFAALQVPPPAALATTYVLLQVISDLAVHPLHHRIEHFLAHHLPPTDEEVLGKPRFLSDQGLAEPESALTLVDSEHHRLLCELPLYVDPIRSDGPESSYAVDVLLSAGAIVARECEHFITALADQHRSHDVLERTNVLRERNDLIMNLQETVHDFHQAAAGTDQPEPIRQLLQSMTDSLHMMLELLAEAHKEPGSEDLALLRTLSHDRSDMMDNVRKGLLATGDRLTPAHQQTAFACTTLFERSVWLLRRYVLSLGILQARPV